MSNRKSFLFTLQSRHLESESKTESEIGKKTELMPSATWRIGILLCVAIVGLHVTPRERKTGNGDPGKGSRTGQGRERHSGKGSSVSGKGYDIYDFLIL